MPPDVRKHWRDPRFWKWWWREVVSSEAKFALAALAAMGTLVAGFLGALGFSPDDEPATFTTSRVVTFLRTLPGDGAMTDERAALLPPVVTKSETITQVPETDVVTVRDKGRTVVVRRPGEQVVVTRPGSTVTRAVTTPGRDRVVTSTGTETVVQTATTDRGVTVTAPGATQTVTREVTGPTVTETRVVTVTQPITVTDVVTVTGALITVTLPLAPTTTGG